MKLVSISRFFFCWMTLAALGYACNSEDKSAETTPAADSLTATAPDTATHHAEMQPDTASVPMVDKAEAMLSATFPDTTLSGTARFETEKNGKVKMKLEITVPAKAGKS